MIATVIVLRTYNVRKVSVTAGDVRPLPVPTMVIGVDGTTVPAATATFTDVEKLPEDTVLDPNVSDTPAGTPEALSSTAPAKSPPREIDSPTLPVPPAATLRLPGSNVSAIVPVTGGSGTVELLLPQAESEPTNVSAANARTRGQECETDNIVEVWVRE